MYLLYCTLVMTLELGIYLFKSLLQYVNVLLSRSFMYLIFTASLFFFFFSFVVLGIKPRAFCMLAKHFTSELRPQLLTLSVDCIG